MNTKMTARVRRSTELAARRRARCRIQTATMLPMTNAETTISLGAGVMPTATSCFVGEGPVMKGKATNGTAAVNGMAISPRRGCLHHQAATTTTKTGVSRYHDCATHTSINERVTATRRRHGLSTVTHMAESSANVATSWAK